MPALALVTRDMLHRGAARFANEPGKAGLMHSMPPRRIKAGCAVGVWPLRCLEQLNGLDPPSRDRWFESCSLQQRVCKLSVPERRTITSLSRRLLPEVTDFKGDGG
jgi:hypothetical protein